MQYFLGSLTPEERLVLSLTTADYLQDMPKGELESMNEGLSNYLKACAKAPVEKKTIKEESEPSFGMLLASKLTGRFKLFDSPVETNSCLRLRLSSAGFTTDHDIEGSSKKVRPQTVRGLWEIDLSGEQYVRAMSSSDVVVPCTITRENGYLHDAPPMQFKPQEQTKSALNKELTAILEPLSKEVQDLIEMMGGNALTSKKALSEVRDRFECVKALYEKLGNQVVASKNNRMQETVMQFAHELNKQWEFEARRLPESLRSQLYLPSLSGGN